MADIVKNVEVLDKKLQVTSYKLQDLKFGYRDSIFKHNKNFQIGKPL